MDGVSTPLRARYVNVIIDSMPLIELTKPRHVSVACCSVLTRVSLEVS